MQDNKKQSGWMGVYTLKIKSPDYRLRQENLLTPVGGSNAGIFFWGFVLGSMLGGDKE
jgi:hypothetical protein